MFKDIKKGFFLGVGFIIPLLFVNYVVVQYTVYEMTGIASSFYDDTFDGEEYSEFFESDDDSHIDQVLLSQLNEVIQGKQLLVSGQFANTSDKDLNSIEIEVELFDEKGAFVYECSKSFYEKTVAGTSQNFLIKCGCSEHGVPDYSTAKVRVIKASVY